MEVLLITLSFLAATKRVSAMMLKPIKQSAIRLIATWAVTQQYL